MKWTISKRILFGYTLAVIILAAVSVVAFISVDRLDIALKERNTIRNRLSIIDNLIILTREAETGQRGFLLTRREDYLQPYTEALAKYSAGLKRFEAAFADDEPEQIRNLSALRDVIEAKFEELAQTISLARSSGFDAAIALVLQDTGRLEQMKINQLSQDMLVLEESKLGASSETVARLKSLLYLTIGLGTPAAMIFTLLIGAATARRIAHPIRDLTIISERIAEGDLRTDIRVIESSDEIGQLSRSFAKMSDSLRQTAAANKQIAAGDLTVSVLPRSGIDQFGTAQAEMIAQLSEVIRRVQRSGVQVNSSAVEIAAATKQQQTTASEVASTTTEISATAREMSTTSTELLKAADSVNAVAESTSVLASDGREGLGRMEQIMRQIMEASAGVSDKLGVMNEKAGNITTVIATITKVADQTNLLSLNAAIEAEKAGEAGRGFSVVATEIRRLADQTASSTLDIERMIKEMTSAVSAGVMGMDKFSEEVRRGVSEVSQVSGQLDQVIERVQSMVPSIESVRDGMRSQDQGSTQISDALAQLGEAARQTADSIRDSSRAVDQLNEATQGLQQSISRFTVPET